MELHAGATFPRPPELVTRTVPVAPDETEVGISVTEATVAAPEVPPQLLPTRQREARFAYAGTVSVSALVDLSKTDTDQSTG